MPCPLRARSNHGPSGASAIALPHQINSNTAAALRMTHHCLDQPRMQRIAGLAVDRHEPPDRAQAARIIALAFSAIITVGALVLPPTRRGITEASTTRSACTPFTRSCGSTTALASLPMRQVPTG